MFIFVTFLFFSVLWNSEMGWIKPPMGWIRPVDRQFDHNNISQDSTTLYVHTLLCSYISQDSKVLYICTLLCSYISQDSKALYIRALLCSYISQDSKELYIHTLLCSYISQDSKALYRMDVAIPPRRRPTIKIQKLLKCWIKQKAFPFLWFVQDQWKYNNIISWCLQCESSLYYY